MSTTLQYYDTSSVLIESEKSSARRAYMIGKRIGEGEFSVVNMAYYHNNGTGQHQRLACKIIDKRRLPSDYLSKFSNREIAILSKIDHPHIITIHSIIERPQQIFIFMENACNGDLFDYILENGPVDEPNAKIWFGQICRAIEYLHSHNIVHRDLKLDNILVMEGMRLKLTDFGFAKFYSEACKLSETFCGTILYAAPEIILNLPYDPKIAEMWSLGVVLFSLLNQSFPFKTHSILSMMIEQQQRKFHFRKSVWFILSRNCKELLLNILEYDVNKRSTLSDIMNSKWFQEFEENT